MPLLTNALTPAQILVSIFTVALVFGAILMNLIKRKEDVWLEKIPLGLVEIDDFKLLINEVNFDIVKTQVFPWLIRDFVFCFSCKDYNGTKMITLYCQPQKTFSFLYQLGCLMQATQVFYTAEKLANIDHVVPQNFPNCIEIKIENVNTFGENDLDDWR